MKHQRIIQQGIHQKKLMKTCLSYNASKDLVVLVINIIQVGCKDHNYGPNEKNTETKRSDVFIV